MTTRERAHALAAAASTFPILGPVSESLLLELVAQELGHAERLDRFCPNGASWSRALPRSPLLHIISGNTPHAGLQSLIRGLLVGAHNRCKIPHDGLPELYALRDRLPAALQGKIEIAQELPDQWINEAETLIVFGSDRTLAHFRERLAPPQTIVEHGHKISFGVIFPGVASLRDLAIAAARDASLYDQQGCLSPHLFYLPESMIAEFGPLLAEEMARFEATTPRGTLSPEEARDLMAARDEARFRAALDPRVRLWQSAEGTAWTVIAESSPRFIPSPLNRLIRLIPLPDDRFLASLAESCAPYRSYFSTIGAAPCGAEQAEGLLPLGGSRITPIGGMQFPGPHWHHDGSPVLLPLVRWIDWEPSPSGATPA